MSATSHRRDEAPRSLNILVLDDNPSVLETTAALIRSLGHRVATSDTAAAAVDAFEVEARRGAPFDGVLLDLSLGGEDTGWEALSRLREVSPGLRAIVMTGHDEEAISAASDARSVVGRLTKPFGLAALEEALRWLESEGAEGGGALNQ